MRLPIPPAPKTSDPVANKWMQDIVKWLETFSRSTPEEVTFPSIAYENVGNLKGIPGVPVIIPDHPAGFSFVLYDGEDFLVFTKTGVL